MVSEYQWSTAAKSLTKNRNLAEPLVVHKQVSKTRM